MESGPQHYGTEEYAEDDVLQADLVRLYLNGLSRGKGLGAELEVDRAQAIEAGLIAEKALRVVRIEDMSQTDHEAAQEGLRSELYEKRIADTLGKKKMALAGRRQLEQEAEEWADSLMDRLTNIASKYPVEDLVELVKEGRAARREMIERNLGLVVNIAKRLPDNKVSFLDLIQHGNLGLIRAVEKFDYTKGYKLSTYAEPWIKNFLQQGMAAEAHDISLPRQFEGQVVKRRRLVNERLSSGEDASESAIAESMGVTVEEVRLYAELDMTMLRLDMPLESEKSGTVHDGAKSLGEYVAGTASDVDQEVVDETRHDATITPYLDTLDPTSREIVLLSYGLLGRPQCANEEIGRRVGYSAEVVSKKLKLALSSMRTIAEAVEAVDLDDSDGIAA